MTMYSDNYSSSYTDSYALVVGINNYEHASPLDYAINDAKAISSLLIDELGFKTEHVELLTNTDATRNQIMEFFLSLSNKTESNDRVVFFFAGHGYTLTGRRGEVGFLVPHDGDTQRLSTLIRWDEITKNAEFIPAKHILFVMDACYGGLALTRTLLPGSMRFLGNMLRRYTRQVLTAGKADEVVSDSGGPLAGHSVFTGHLIEALRGGAESEEGIITANGVMSYVYEKVAKDRDSHQTPHYGFLDGDGDFVFKAPLLNITSSLEETNEDILFTIPSIMPEKGINASGSITDYAKEYLSDSRFTIKLDELVKQEIRRTLYLTSDDNFEIDKTDWSLGEFVRRLEEYERIVSDLQQVLCYIAYYGKVEHLPILRNSLSRLTDNLIPRGGMPIWNNLRWYPVMLLLYSSSISALASNNYHNLLSIFLTQVSSPDNKKSMAPLALAIGTPILELTRSDAFKLLPGHENQYVPRSEYLFKQLQPVLDDTLFLGREYERLFDRFEILLALTYADLDKRLPEESHIWAPVGRFAWKFRNRENDPLTEMTLEAKKQMNSWSPIAAGFFQGNFVRFEKISDELVRFVNKLGWQ